MNLNIEGTKHEKAVLVILSYVSGFTAGFIIFGLTQSASLRNVPVMADPVFTETSEEMTVVFPEEGSMTPPETVDQSSQVLYKDGRLMANVNGASVLLSAQLKTVDAETAEAFASQGVHEAIPNFATSDDGAFIYYCEQHDTADSCINFIYSVDTQMIQYVTIDGQKAITDSATAKSATWSGEIFNLAGAASVSPLTPWKLVSAQ
jgi:hypothetical protein